MENKLDWSTDYTDDEWRDLRAHYDQLMGPGEVDELFKFIPFMHEVRPDVLKRYRLNVDVTTNGVGLVESMPNPPVASLVAGHYYTTIPYPEGSQPISSWPSESEGASRKSATFSAWPGCTQACTASTQPLESANH